MNADNVEEVARAVMYEGYLLYPFTATALKNQHRWTFGVLYPPQYDTPEMRTECLAYGNTETQLTVSIRYLQLDGEQTREHEAGMEFSVACSSMIRRFAHAEVEGEAEIRVQEAAEGLLRFRIQVRNRSSFAGGGRDAALARSLISVHMILRLEKGEFLSLIDPPESCREAALACRNIGAWPVLIGSVTQRNTMLSAPIILYDYPEIAPESHGNLFDGTEIDELLSLRILALSDAEKDSIRGGDPKGRDILDRIESLSQPRLAQLHGAIRARKAAQFQAGMRVRLRPKRSADILDLALAGKTALVESVEEDLEGRIHVAVVLEDDPGRDLGMIHQPGHRFFFSPEEVEALE
jgi:hypothetical protein